MVATDSRWSVPPHIQPPMAQVPSATRDTMSWRCGNIYEFGFDGRDLQLR